MKEKFTSPVIEVRGLAAEKVMADDLAIFANSPGQGMSRAGMTMTDTVQKEYNAWKGLK